MTKSNKLTPGPQLGYIVVFSASDWEHLERAYGQELPDRARKLIGLATLHFTLSLPMEKNAPKVGGKNSDVLDEIKQLIVKAELLRAKLYPPHHWSEEYRTDMAPRRLDWRLSIELEAIDDKPHNESDILRICLTGLIESGWKLLRRPNVIHEGDAWNAWVVWITLIMQAFELPIGVRESDVYRVNRRNDPYRDKKEKKPSRFVNLLKALQATTCSTYHRSSTDGGLAKAIARARQSIKAPQNIGGSVGTDQLERELLMTFNINAYAQLSVRDAVNMVIDGTRVCTQIDY